MSSRHLPVRPNFRQLKAQAKDLLRAVRAGDPSAVEELRAHHPGGVAPENAKLADAQLALARAYGVRSWPRLVLACRVVDAIWRNQVKRLRGLVLQNPHLLHEMARGTEESNWGPPMAYAANLGRDRIITMLHDLGAQDLEWALGRAVLQGRIRTARKLHSMGARPPKGEIMGPAETQNPSGMEYLLELGAAICDEHGDRLAPVALVLETYSRNTPGKHACLELLARHGIDLPDTPTMALHRGRIDLLEQHLREDSRLLERTFRHSDIWPPQLGCHEDESLALHGTPLAGATLLHMAVDYGELEIARWLLDHGADVNTKANVDVDGFGGHTPLFNAVVRCGQLQTRRLTRMLLKRGADPNARASLRRRMRFIDDESEHEYRDVTPVS
jgi:hypothetical protein